jgi:hypothetical protein
MDAAGLQRTRFNVQTSFIPIFIIIDFASIIIKKSSSYLSSFVLLPSSTYLFTAGVEGFYFHLITLRHTPQMVGLLWTRDRPVAETST